MAQKFKNACFWKLLISKFYCEIEKWNENERLWEENVCFSKMQIKLRAGKSPVNLS